MSSLYIIKTSFFISFGFLELSIYNFFFLFLQTIRQFACSGQQMVRERKLFFIYKSYLMINWLTAAAALRGVAIQTSRARAAFPTRTFARLPTPIGSATAANALHGYAPWVLNYCHIFRLFLSKQFQHVLRPVQCDDCRSRCCIKRSEYAFTSKFKSS